MEKTLFACTPDSTAEPSPLRKPPWQLLLDALIPPLLWRQALLPGLNTRIPSCQQVELSIGSVPAASTSGWLVPSWSRCQLLAGCVHLEASVGEVSWVGSGSDALLPTVTGPIPLQASLQLHGNDSGVCSQALSLCCSGLVKWFSYFLPHHQLFYMQPHLNPLLYFSVTGKSLFSGKREMARETSSNDNLSLSPLTGNQFTLKFPLIWIAS